MGSGCLHVSSSSSFPNQKNGTFTIWQQMMVARFFMGVGIGGEYPMASTITAETSSQSTRGRNLAAVFAMQVSQRRQTLEEGREDCSSSR